MGAVPGGPAPDGPGRWRAGRAGWDEPLDQRVEPGSDGLGFIIDS